jgi:RHS repeat-associated protein
VAGGSPSDTYGYGGSGRIAVYYESTFSGNFTPGYLQKSDTADTIFNADFETANLSQWTSNVNDGGNLSASDSADYWGLQGLSALANDNNPIYAQDDTPNNETQYRARFYFNPNSVTMATNDVLDIFTGRNATNDVVRIQLQKTAASYQIRAGLLNDAGVWTDTSWYDASSTWGAIEIQYQAFANSGSLTLWLDDVQKQSLTYVDNDTRTITDVRLGAQGIETGTRGTLYFDDFESRRFSYIGTLPDPGVNDPTASNPAGWFTRTYTYSSTIPHAVTNVIPETGSPDTYAYDANGNMTCRVENGVTYTHTYNAENRAASIARRSGSCASGTILESWSFAYDGDGVRVMTAHFTGTSGTPDSTTAYYMGGQYELKDGVAKKYYSIAGMMVATQDASGLQYLLTDHLGSVAAVTNSTGTLISQQRYLPFGAVRTDVGPAVSQTDFGYTGQRMLDSGMGGIMDYKARFYSPYINRFLQPDSIIPDLSNPQSWNRYDYVTNRPVNFNDPTGHMLDKGDGAGSPGCKVLGTCPKPPPVPKLSTPPSGSGSGSGNSSNDGLNCPRHHPNCGFGPNECGQYGISNCPAKLYDGSDLLANPPQIDTLHYIDSNYVKTRIPIYDFSSTPPKVIGYRVISYVYNYDSYHVDPTAIFISSPGAPGNPTKLVSPIYSITNRIYMATKQITSLLFKSFGDDVAVTPLCPICPPIFATSSILTNTNKVITFDVQLQLSDYYVEYYSGQGDFDTPFDFP